MKIVVLGGYDRFGPYLEKYAKSLGLEINFINQPKKDLEKLLKNADYIVVLTRCVSHEMVRCAKGFSPEKCIFCKQAGLCAIKKIIEEKILKTFNN
ncbi:hypothetical protein THC_0090 [Caldimicrobium thiodismutans]|uniref:DUF2325 domain-containing protein n=1 Tax=Caldimicrobium thiodismutans TaxID=1653476 RepID=A0A0U5B3B5_9BACT|nr:DUF2325 domain-containing protein [Caldimicrobium thiodismutans]BAU22496.1 hypothetical protein THC_0090 [Caldimicrobium thiodismutans]